MYLIWFLTIGAVLSIVLGEFGQYPFGSTTFSVSLTDLFLGLILLLLLIWQIQTKTLPTKLPKFFSFIGVFWLICIVSLFWSFNFSGVGYLARFVVYSSAAYLGYSLVRSKVSNFLSLAKIILISGVLLSLLGFVQFLFYPDLEPYYIYGYDPHKNRLFSTFLDPNLLGTYLNISLMMGLVLFALSKSKFARLVNFTSIILLFSAIILTFSRSAYLMLTVQLAIFFWFYSRKVLLLLGILSVMIVLIVAPVRERIVGAVYLDKSASERIYSWQNGLYIISQRPILGVGFNNLRESQIELQLLRADQKQTVNSGSGLDSSLLFVAATTGIIGFISFISMIGYLLFSLFKQVKYEQKLFAICLLSLVFAILVNSLFINSLFFTPVIFVVYLLIGAWFDTKKK